jgi:hypothetical protein
MINLKDLIPRVLAEMEARRIKQPDSEQLTLFENVYELYNHEREELNRIFYEFERSFETSRAKFMPRQHIA